VPVPDFWLDSDVYIEANKREYGFDIVPGFWEMLEKSARDGILKSPSFVYDEIVRYADDVAEWVRARREVLFIDPTEDIQHRYAEVANHVAATYTNQTEVHRYLSGADPWLVAYASALGGTVVTRERRIDSSVKTKIKIPNVCDHFNVPSIDPWTMVRRLGGSFR
jgi:hypothetical protein